MKYLVSVGHTASGNLGCGAVGKLNESNCTRQIAPLVVKKLQSLGHSAVKLQIDNSDSKDYVKRVNQANSLGGDLFVEIHLNAGMGYKGDGVEVLTVPNSSASSLAVRVSQTIATKTGISNRGHKTSTGLYVLKHTFMPSILIEVCFVDGSNWKNYNADKIANAIVEGLTGQSIKNTKGQWLKGTSEGDTDKWWYKHSDGSYTKSNWEKIDGEWYFFDYNGWMCTGWVVWKDKDYYCYGNGIMAHNCVLYGYKFDSNGVATKI